MQDITDQTDCQQNNPRWNSKEKEFEQKCLHRSCPECQGNGRKKNGEICIHMISCPCKRCSFRF